MCVCETLCECIYGWGGGGGEKERERKDILECEEL